MKTIRLYRNPKCVKCARLARIHRLFDWLNRLEDSTEDSPLGPLAPGEIAVQHLPTSTTFKGAESVKLLCKNIPAYWPCLPLFYLTMFRAFVDREVQGCNDGSCSIRPSLELKTQSVAQLPNQKANASNQKMDRSCE